ncbi:MAG: sulfotransferase [Bacteroidales bacterium]
MKEELLALLQYGISKKRVRIFDLRENDFNDLYPPVFFLSTVRTGTKWFADLFSKSKKTLVFHVPKPDLSVQGVFAYNLFERGRLDKDEDLWQSIAEIFLAGREQHLRYSYKTEKQYIETNNFLTFFAPVLAKLFPHAKFVHIYRHPGEFVSSAINRNYYADTDNNKMRRIKPVEGHYYDTWDNLSQLEKSAWLWNETNLFLEDFKSKINADRVFSFNFNELTLGNVKSLAQFIGVGLKENTIRKNMQKKKNVQKKRKYPPYEKWGNQNKSQLKNICGNLAGKYGYRV